jgi:hypothetical protein
MANIPVTFKTQIGKLDYLNTRYLEVPKRIVTKLGGTLSARLKCTVNNAIEFQCGLMALGEGRAYISINATRLKKLKVTEGDTVSVSLVKDESEYGMDMPIEMIEIFKQDAEAKRRFDMLTPGKQRYVIFYVAGVKNQQLRIDRAMLLLENLKKLPEGKEEFRAMLGKK